MNNAEFERILTAFADSRADVESSRGKILAQVRGEVVEASVRLRDGELVVDDNLETGVPARRWLVTRIARLPQLADRIIDTIGPVKHFIRPSGELDGHAEAEAVEAKYLADAVGQIERTLASRPGGTTSILYVTSDAGEGKTTIIRQLAWQQATAYKHKENEADWLLLPVTLAGRTFMRFDDIVIAELVNRYRFPFFYYDGFVELVKMGVIVPAFDGFEEMFVEGASGEALSALGTLLRSLDSNGAVLLAARKAYFEFKSLSTRTRLFDAISANSVSFARVKLKRWSKEQFLQYAKGRGFAKAEELYTAVEQRLGADHALLTRAVLVERLLFVAESHSSLTSLLAALGHAPADYFHEFVEALLVREVNEKWIDRQGDAAEPLLTLEQHDEMLGVVAQEMWIGATEVLRLETLDLVADLFAESHRLSPAQTHQVKERLPQHSLLTASGSMYCFDHEDFRKYFLGESIGRAIQDHRNEVKSLLRAGALPDDTCDAIARYVRRTIGKSEPVIKFLAELGGADLPTSFVRENCGSLIVRLLDGLQSPQLLANISFPAGALNGRQLKGHTFVDCYWPASTLEGASLAQLTFRGCRIDSLELTESTRFDDVKFLDCHIIAVARERGGIRTFDPDLIRKLLAHAGGSFGDKALKPAQGPDVEPDVEVELVERLLRTLLRTTQVNEETLRRRFGTRANKFMEDVLPELLDVHVLDEIRYLGAGHGRRFKLAAQMEHVEEALAVSGGRYKDFLAAVQKVRPTR